MPYLLDTNILLRLVRPSDPQHSLAKESIKALRGARETVYITPQNLIEFWAVATRPEGVNGLGMAPAETGQEMVKMVELFPMVPDMPLIFPIWQRLVLSAGVSGVQVHDTRLVAVMLAYNISHILTFNTGDFKKFTSEITVIDPADVESVISASQQSENPPGRSAETGEHNP